MKKPIWFVLSIIMIVISMVFAFSGEVSKGIYELLLWCVLDKWMED